MHDAVWQYRWFVYWPAVFAIAAMLFISVMSRLGRLHWQDLNDEKNRDGTPLRRHWKHGRCWFYLRSADRRRKRFNTLAIEWTLWRPSHTGWSLEFGGEDDELAVGFTIPLLFRAHVALWGALPANFIAWDVDRGDDRKIEIYFFEWAVWYFVWVGGMASWSRKYPWCRWWRQGCFHFADLLGKSRHTCETIRENIPVLIPMPEGVYRGVAKQEKRTWRRPLWFARVRYATSVDVPKGIPFQGKGENSYDCGDDGLFGAGVEGLSIEKAIGHVVASVLDSRRRYGMPSQEAIRTALAGEARA